MPYLGEVKMFAGNVPPPGWEFCNGQLLPIAGEFETLFSLLGTTYGGDGVSQFALPDLRGRMPIHMGQGNGLSNRTIGEIAGAETVALNETELPPHHHPVHAGTAVGTQASPANNAWASGSTGERQYTRNAANVVMSPDCTTLAGEGRPHENMMPFQAVSYIIATLGIYPSRN